MKNSTILRLVVFGAIVIIGILSMQTYWVVNSWNINEEDFNKKVNLALYNVAKSLADINRSKLPPRNIINQRTTNYYIVNIEDEIDANLLEYFLQKEFESLALNVDFEYAVFDCTTDEMVYGNYIGYAPDGPGHRMELGNLPKYSDFNYYFGVKFPNRSGFLLGKMQLSIVFSIILLLTVVFFAYAMYIILHQKRLSEMQKDFINNMTHEFKTPLSTIKISADVFLNHDEVQRDNRLMQYARIIRDQNQRLNQQVEKVLQLAKIERGSFEIKRESVSVAGLLQPIVESIRLQLEKRGGCLKVDMPDTGLELSADPLHLTNVVYNLLDNAIKYCRRRPEIQLQVESRERQVRICIRDNGIGIKKEYQNRVFDKFFRIPTGNVHNVKGFGLGLYYVSKVCRAHGWRIQLDSEPERGTIAIITIPVKS